MSSFHSKDRRQADELRASVDKSVRYQPVISPLSELMTDLDRVRYGGLLTPDLDDGHFDVWQDEQHIYLQAEIQNLNDKYVDICINNKFIYIRFNK